MGKQTEKPAKKPKKVTPPAPKLVRLAPSDLTACPELQLRAGGIDPDHVRALRSEVEAGAELPPIKAVELADGRRVITDGFHTHLASSPDAAAGWAGLDRVKVELTKTGTWTDALLAACAANRDHRPNRPRTDEDKRNAVRVLQETLAAAGLNWSENRQAKHLGVSRGLLQVMKHGRRPAAKDPQTPTETANAPAAVDDRAGSRDVGGSPDGTVAPRPEGPPAGGVTGSQADCAPTVPGPETEVVATVTPVLLAGLDLPDDLHFRVIESGVHTVEMLRDRVAAGETFDLDDDAYAGLCEMLGIPGPRNDPEPPAPRPAAGAALPVPRKVYCPCPYLRADGTHEQCTNPKQCKVCRGRGDLTEEEFDGLPPRVKKLCRVPGSVPAGPPHPFEDLLAAVTGLARKVTLAMNAPGGERLKKYLSHAGLVDHKDLIVDGRHYGASFKLLRGLRRLVYLAGLPGREKTAAQVRVDYAGDDTAGAA